MKSAMQDLEQKLMKIGESVYQAQQAAGAQQGAAGAQQQQTPPQDGPKHDEGFVDAEVVDDK